MSSTIKGEYFITEGGYKVKNQWVLYDGDTIYFQSYFSIIAKLEGGKLTLGRHWNYSHTTAKYRNKFIRHFTGMDGRADNLRKLMKEGTILYDETMV